MAINFYSLGVIDLGEMERYTKKTVTGINADQHPYLLSPGGYVNFTVGRTR